MDAELEAWLDRVWQRKDEIVGQSMAQGAVKGRGAVLGEDNDGIWTIYAMYNGAGSDTKVARVYVDRYLQRMDQLEGALKTAPQFQFAGRFKNFPLGTIHKARTDGTGRDAIANAFLHFRKQRENSPKRIYVNAKPEYRGDVFATILDNCKAWEVNGLVNAKVTGPEDNGRTDSIVIYAADERSRDAIVMCLRPYNSSNPQYFGDTLPMLTEAVAGLKGVSTADEPPSRQIVRSGGKYHSRRGEQSFGFYRSSFIFMALDRTSFEQAQQSDAERCKAFKRRAAKYFTAAGVDPDRPALQGPPAEGMLGWRDLEARLARVAD